MVRDTKSGEKHFCASVLILSKEYPQRIVLVHHKKMNVWLQPGGHMEQFENPVETAIRETKEETGLDISFLLKKIEFIDTFASKLPVPDFFLEETIPAHKNEPEHFHLDLFYKVEIPFQTLQVQQEESHDIGWFTLEEALKLPMYENTKMLIKKIFDNKG